MTTATQTQTPDAETKPKGLAAKLVEASLEVENVEKRGRNTQQNYSYAQAEDVAAAATKALLARGVLSVFECLSAESHPIRSKSGTDGLITTVSCQLVVTDSESGENASKLAMGSGSDYPGDKAIYKAMTGARKYAFIHLLGIPLGDDPDAHRPEGAGGRRKQSAPNLPPEVVDRIRDGFKALEMPWSRIELLMGSVGANAPKVRRADSLLKAIREMEPAQAVELEKLIQREADSGS